MGSKTFMCGIVAAATIALSAASSFALVTNGDFETGTLSGWIGGGVRSGASKSYSGSYCGYVSKEAPLQKQTIAVSPNTTYKLSGYVKIDEAGAIATIGVMNHGGTTVSATRTASTEYGLVSVFFTTGASATSATIFLEHTDESWNWHYWDKVTVEQFTQPISIANGTFENGTIDPWVVVERGGIANNYRYEGNYAGYAGHNGAIQQIIGGLKPNTTYTISAFMRSADAANMGVLGVKNYTTSSNYVEVQSAIDGSFSKKSVQFTTGSTNTSAVVYFKKLGTGWNWAYLDNISINAASQSRPPIAAFTVDQWSNYTNSAMTVEASQSYDPDGDSIVSYSWDFGMHSPGYEYRNTEERSDAGTVYFSYDFPGTYTVTLTVTNDKGEVGVTTRQVTVVARPGTPPVAQLSVWPVSGKAPLTVNCVSSSYDPQGENVDITWYKGYGKPGGSGDSSSFTYDTPGIYTIVIWAVDEEGIIDSAQVTVTVTE